MVFTILRVKMLTAILTCTYFSPLAAIRDLSTPPQVSMFHEMIARFEYEASKNLQLIPIASGGGVHEKIERIKVFFNFPGRLSIDEARCLEVRACELFLRIINDFPGARASLNHYPFSPKDITVNIGFAAQKESAPKSLVFEEQPDVVSIHHGVISYKKDLSDQRRYITILEEPFEEAARIVHQSEEGNASEKR